MNRSLLISMIGLSLAATLNAQPKRTQSPLQLSVNVISQSYCSVTADSAALELKLKLRYRNISSQKVILYNGHDFFYQSKIRSAPGNTSGPYEVWVVNSRYFDEEMEPIDQPSPAGKVFLILRPGAAYEREIMIGVGVVNDKVPRGDSSIRAGNHTLQLIVSTWYQPRSLAQKLRQQWEPKGMLWSEPLFSTPVSFVAQRPAALLPCKSSSPE